MTPDYEGFLRQLPARSFVPDGTPIAPSDIVRDAGVEVALLPESYRVFLSTVGLGYWGNDSGEIVAPAALYAFDADCGEMEGFVALVQNAAGVGDYLAVNPADAVTDGERPLYYCGHDPFSCVRAADSFEAWVRESAGIRASRGRRYAHLDESRFESYARHKAAERAAAPKQWWQFWR
jgi:hypothetical protein